MNCMAAGKENLTSIKAVADADPLWQRRPTEEQGTSRVLITRLVKKNTVLTMTNVP